MITSVCVQAAALLCQVWPSLTCRSQREIESGSEVTAWEAAKPVGAGTAGQVEEINRVCAKNRNQLPLVQEEPQDDSTAQFGGQPGDIMTAC